MTSLGQILLEHGWITRGQLDQAIERQQQLGGRLGTCVLELGLVSESFLLQALSEQLSAPIATAEDLDAVAPEVLAHLPTKIAIRNHAIPFRATSSSLDVAMVDVGDLTLEDEISFVASKRVRFHIATELRIAEALAKYYGCDIPLRLATLAQSARSSAGVENTARSAQTATPSPPPTPQPDEARGGTRVSGSVTASSGARHVVPPLPRETPRSIPLTDAERSALNRVRERESNGQATPLERFTMDLVRAETSSEIGKALVDVLGHHFVRVLLFRVSGSRQEITGWLAEGPDIASEWFHNYSIGLRQNSIFRRLQDTREIFMGRLQSHPVHQALARCWGDSLDYECLLIPVFVRERLVCVAYCDRSSLGLDNLDLERIDHLGKKAALAFERCILRRKLQTT